MDNIQIMSPQEVLNAIRDYSKSSRVAKYKRMSSLHSGYEYLDISIKYEERDILLSSIDVAAVLVYQAVELPEKELSLSKREIADGYDIGYSLMKKEISNRIINIAQNIKQKWIVLRSMYNSILDVPISRLLFCDLRGYKEIGKREGKLLALREAIIDVENIIVKGENNDNLPQDLGSYHYDSTKINKIYVFCNDTDVFEEVTLHDFGRYIANADFSKLYNDQKTIKSKLKYIITVIYATMDSNNWCRKVTDSIGLTPSKCSGANVPIDWRDKVSKLKKQLESD